MKITKHAQSCFLVETGDVKILIDPGNFVFEKEGFDPANFTNIDAVFISHPHSDHLDLPNLVKIADKNHATVYANQQVNDEVLSGAGLSGVEVLKDGDAADVKGVQVKVIKSEHGPLPTGDTPPDVMGFLIDDGTTTFYDPADTMELMATADVIAEPICDKVVMDIEKAKSEAIRTKPKLVIPIHYDNPAFPVEVEDFVSAMSDTGIEVRVLGYGESVEA